MGALEETIACLGLSFQTREFQQISTNLAYCDALGRWVQSPESGLHHVSLEGMAETLVCPKPWKFPCKHLTRAIWPVKGTLQPYLRRGRRLEGGMLRRFKSFESMARQQRQLRIVWMRDGKNMAGAFPCDRSASSRRWSAMHRRHLLHQPIMIPQLHQAWAGAHANSYHGILLRISVSFQPGPYHWICWYFLPDFVTICRPMSWMIPIP